MSLSIAGLPNGVSGSFSPSNGKPSFQLVLTLHASTTSATGLFTLTVTARDAKGSKTMPIVFKNYTVNIPPPTVPPEQPFTADIWVSKSGNNAWDGTTETFQSGTIGPKLTIAAGLGAIGFSAGAGANKTVAVLSGEYAERLTAFPTGTSWSAPFTLISKPGNSVTIKPTGAPGGVHIFDLESSVDYYTICERFTLDATNQDDASGTTRVLGNFVKFRYLDLINNQRQGIFIEGNNCEVFGGSIHDGPFGSAPPGPIYNYPIYNAGSNNIIDGVEIYNFPSFGLHIYHNVTESNNIVRNCIIHNGAQLDFGRSAILYGENETDGQIYNNVVYDMEFAGHGLTISGSDTLIYNNTVYGCPEIGIWINSNTGFFVRNNIACNNTGGNYLDQGTGTTLETNSFDGTNPQFLSPGTGDFHLTGSSPSDIRNGGTDLSATFTTDIENTTRPIGAGTWSMGAYERA